MGMLLVSAPRGRRSEYLIALIVLGPVLLAAFAVWKTLSVPVSCFPWEHLRDRSILGANLLYAVFRALPCLDGFSLAVLASARQVSTLRLRRCLGRPTHHPRHRARQARRLPASRSQKPGHGYLQRYGPAAGVSEGEPERNAIIKAYDDVQREHSLCRPLSLLHPDLEQRRRRDARGKQTKGNVS
ncbi:hypothetical protein CDD83_7551 [Cordyceps sp. RAO-2017]|nr:hypothetical protein CDD83_7551 [Cordyceps sp. RAO-2017]